jgi:beta-galactosidase/beta-glucuronidase
MTRLGHIALLSFLTTTVFAAEDPVRANPSLTGPRGDRELNSGWRFQIDVRDQGENERWFNPGFDRSEWSAVDVPRAWDTFDESLRGFEGAGWYTVAVDGAWARPDKLQRLIFGRVMYHTRAWLNGEFLGEHIDGYLPFRFDVTGKLKPSNNQLVLRVDNRPRTEWLPAAQEIEWVQYGGILQPVQLETGGKIAISDVAVRAVPQGVKASITCAVEIEAHENSDDVQLRVRVAGEEASTRTLKIAARNGVTARHEVPLTLERADVWSPDSPKLYTLVATLERDGAAIDRVSTEFGIRTIEARGRQLLLNGKPLKIRGVNRYDEYGRFGPNPPWPLVEAEFRLMKRVGINLVRTHYPQTPELLALCDRLGMLFLEELPINWWGVDWGGKEGLLQNERILDQALPMLETMIRRDRNHPCIIIWSMANESKTDSEVGIKVMRTLIERARILDQSRLVTFVTDQASVKDHRAFSDADLVAINIYPGSLGPPLANHLDQLDERVRKPAEGNMRDRLAAFPDKPMLVTEFGAAGFRTIRGDVPSGEDFQAAYITKIWAAIAGNSDVSGGILWSWADYYHRRHFQSLGAFGAFGVVTVDRQPKSALEALAKAYGGTLRP